jgi:hypothetical protein
MTQELTISRYNNKTSIGYEVMTSVFFFLTFSGLTILGIWIFKFADQTSPTKTGKKKEDKYFDELGVPGIVITYIFLLALFFVIYHNHMLDDDVTPLG